MLETEIHAASDCESKFNDAHENISIQLRVNQLRAKSKEYLNPS